MNEDIDFVEFELNIISNGTVYWIDTLQIDLLTYLNDQITLLPSDYLLEQNYPNPFNPSTIIEYTIPNQSTVTLTVFDVLGREAKKLVEKQQLQGNYEKLLVNG